MFVGSYTPKLDEKNRLFLPAKFREQLAEGLVETKGQGFCLNVFPHADFAALTLTSEVLCDAVIGVVLGELWRDGDAERTTRVRAELVELVRGRIGQLVGKP